MDKTVSLVEAEADLAKGELYLFPHDGEDAIFEYVGLDRSQRVVFVGKTSKTTKKLCKDEFVALRNRESGHRAIRVVDARRASASASAVDPREFMDENDPKLSGRDRNAITRLRRKRLRARSLYFFCCRFDAEPVGTGEISLTRFIRKHAAEAERQKLESHYSASTLRRALRHHGAPGDRDIRDYFSNTTDKGSRWGPFIHNCKIQLIDEYWSKAAPRLKEVVNTFSDRVEAENKRLQALGAEPLDPPSPEALRLWIKGAECYDRYALRHGKRAASRRYRGQNRAIQATRPLEFVMFDHTRVDAWANVAGEDGETILQERPWLMLAVDVFTRMILAAVLTYEPPSIYTVVLGLKQMVRPKKLFPKDLRGFKGVDDGWGHASNIIVDNGWENTEASFQTMCEGAGINVIWAPVRTPEYKCHVEHAFHVLNQDCWHRLPSGIPHKPHVMTQLGLDPRAKADRGIEELRDGLWRAIGQYHLRVNDGISMAPARAWREGLEKHGRRMIDDVTAFDLLLGRVRYCQLTTSGIRLDGQKFHDPGVTSKLLNDMLRYSKASAQRKAPNSTGTMFVLVTVTASTCGYIHVWNPRTRRNVRLPNINPTFSVLVSWDEAKAARKLADEENLAFCSDSEMLAVAMKLQESYEPRMKNLPYREARKLTRKQVPAFTLVPGSTVEAKTEAPSPTGQASQQITVSIAAQEREGRRRPPKSARRGGESATRKSMKARQKNKDASKTSQKSQPSGKKPHRAPTVEMTRGAAYQVEDPKALLAELAARMQQR
jgi:putative transposase